MPNNVVGVIPARGGSKRVPRKNVRDVDGKPMVAHAIGAAHASGRLDSVYVSTDDPEIAKVAQDHDADVPRDRPAKLAGDDAGIVEVCLDLLDFLEGRGEHYDQLCVILPSAPLVTGEDVTGTLERLDEAGASFAMAVTEYRFPPWQALVEEDGELEPYWDPMVVEKSSQEVPPLRVDSGSVYAVEVEAFQDAATFYGDGLVGYEIPPERGLDVDEPFELRLARTLRPAILGDDRP